MCNYMEYLKMEGKILVPLKSMGFHPEFFRNTIKG